MPFLTQADPFPPDGHDRIGCRKMQSENSQGPRTLLLRTCLQPTPSSLATQGPAGGSFLLAMHAASMYNYCMCYACGTPLPHGSKPGFNDTCPQCGKDLHVCLMCRFYAPGSHWDCREHIDDYVSDKEKRNHCEWFSPDPRFYREHTAGAEASSKGARDRFNALFGN